MKIERMNRAEVRLQDFADKQALVMRVTEYASPPRKFRFSAAFVGAEISKGCVLESANGDGHSEDEAVADYAVRISRALLIVDAMTSARREISAPTFSRYTSEES